MGKLLPSSTATSETVLFRHAQRDTVARKRCGRSSEGEGNVVLARRGIRQGGATPAERLQELEEEGIFAGEELLRDTLCMEELRHEVGVVGAP